MSAYQTGRQVVVAYKEETTFGEKPTATGATLFRPNSGGINLTKAAIESNENRSDGMRTRGRHGSRSVAGNYAGDLSLGTFDALIEAVMRGTWQAEITIDDATAALSSATISASGNTVTFSGGSVITAGARVGDIHRWSIGLDNADLDKNLRVTAVTATTITYAESLTTVAGPVSTYEFTIPKRLIQGTTRRSFTVEEYEADIDGSEVYTGCRVGSMRLQMQPDGMATVEFGFVGKDMEVLEGASAPYFTSPTGTTSLGLTSVEAVIRLGTEDVVDLTSVDLSIDLNASGNPVVGSNTTPDVFDNLATVTGTITALRKDMTRVTQFINETQLSLHLLFTENEAEPSDFVSVFVGNLTLASAEKSALGQDGARTQTLQMMIGKDERGSGYDASMLKVQTSAT